MEAIDISFFNMTFFVALIIMVFLCQRGYRKGFLYVIFGVIAIIFMVLFTALTEPYVTEMIKEYTPVEENLHELIEEDLNKRADTLIMDNGGSAAQNFVDSLPESLSIKINEKSKNAKDTVIENTADALCNRAMSGISSVLTMIAGIVIVLLVRAIILAIGKVPVIRGINKFFGLLTGFVEGIMCIWVIMFFASRFVSSELGHAIIEDCGENFILAYLYNFNPIVWFLG